MISFGRVSRALPLASTCGGAASLVMRFALTFAGYGPYCASLNSNLLYCTISVPPLNTYSSSRRLFARRSSRRSYARTPVTIASNRERSPQARSSAVIICTFAPSCSMAGGT